MVIWVGSETCLMLKRSVTVCALQLDLRHRQRARDLDAVDDDRIRRVIDDLHRLEGIGEGEGGRALGVGDRAHEVWTSPSRVVNWTSPGSLFSILSTTISPSALTADEPGVSLPPLTVTLVAVSMSPLASITRVGVGPERITRFAFQSMVRLSVVLSEVMLLLAASP